MKIRACRGVCIGVDRHLKPGDLADLDAAQVKEAQALGLQVLAWTVNEPQHIEAMLDLGVDGIVSDRPDRVRTAMARRGMALPAPLNVTP